MNANENRRRSSVDSNDLDALAKGITTRVLADRLRTLSQQYSGERVDNNTGANRRASEGSRRASTDSRRVSDGGGGRKKSESERRRSSADENTARRPSKFLTGTAIPNSVIKSNLNVIEPVEKDADTLRKERDERVSQIIETLAPKYKRQSYDESRDLEALAKIRKELQKRSSIITASDKKSETEIVEKKSATNKKDFLDSKETLRKQKRRTSCRTESFLPLSCNRTPTFESVKRAVDNARLSKVLINADELVQRSTRNKSSIDYSESAENIGRQPSTFITRRKFIPKLEKTKANKVKDSSLEILQPGINRPPTIMLESKSRVSRFDDEDDVTVFKYNTNKALTVGTKSSELS